MNIKVNKTVKKNINQKSGFTIIELMIATTVFSVVLLVAGTAVIAIGRIYFKNINSTRVQEATRSVMEDVTRSLQFSSGIVSSDLDEEIKVRCFNDARYTYTLNDPVGVEGSSGYGLKVDRTPAQGCLIGVVDGVDLNPSPNARQLLGNNMRLLQFDVSNGAGGTFNVSVKIAYGDNDLLTIYNNDGDPVGWNQPIEPAEESTIASALCKNGAGSTFCSVAGLETSVSSRIK